MMYDSKVKGEGLLRVMGTGQCFLRIGIGTIQRIAKWRYTNLKLSAQQRRQLQNEEKKNFFNFMSSMEILLRIYKELKKKSRPKSSNQ